MAAKPVRVAFLVDPAGGPDYPLHRLQIKGVRRAVDELGVQAEVVTPSPREGAAAALARFGRQGYDLVIGFDFNTLQTVAYVARRYRRTVFAALDTWRNYLERPLDPAKCRRVALAQFAKGAGTVFDVAGDCGRGTLAAAKEQGRWAIGVDFDRSNLGPHILSSALKLYDIAVFELIRTFVRGRLLPGRDYPQTVGNGVLALGRFSPVVPEAIRERVRAIARDVGAGRIGRIPEP